MSTQGSTFLDQFPAEAKVVRTTFYSAFAALFVGALMGLMQVLHRTDVLRIVDSADYY